MPIDTEHLTRVEEANANPADNVGLVCDLSREYTGYARRTLVETFNEGLAEAVMLYASRKDINRLGTSLLTWHHLEGPDGWNHQSERLLRAALERAGAGAGTKLFTAELLHSLSRTPLLDELAGDNPDLLERMINRALGGVDLVTGIGDIYQHHHVDGIAQAQAKLRALLPAEKVALLHRSPSISAVSFDDVVIYVRNNAHTHTAEDWHRWLTSLYYRVSPEFPDVVRSIIADNLENIRGAVERNPGWLRAGNDGELPHLWEMYSDTHRWDVNIVDEVAPLLDGYVDVHMFNHVLKLLSSLKARMSVEVVLRLLDHNPKLLGLIFSGNPDGSDDATLAAAGMVAVNRLAGQGETVLRTRLRWSFAHEHAERMLRNVQISNVALLRWLLSGDYNMVHTWLAGEYPANRPTKEQVAYMGLILDPISVAWMWHTRKELVASRWAVRYSPGLSDWIHLGGPRRLVNGTPYHDDKVAILAHVDFSEML